MIRTESFAVSRETFAAERKQILTDAAADLHPHVLDALNRVGLPSWEQPLVSAALDLFDQTARGEVDVWGPVLDDMHDLFAEELATALKLTKRSDNPAAQADTLARWVAQMAHNAGIEAATTSDTDNNIGLEWVTMSDAAVRSPHKEAHGQTVPTGQEFEVGGEKLLYPGQPVGDPSNWINCRCLARPTMLDGELAAGTLVAAGAPEPTPMEEDAPKQATSTVIVALPAADDPITAASSEASGAHATLLFLGDSAQLDEAALNAAVEQFVTAGKVGIITETVNGRATLGSDLADVVLFDAHNLVYIRQGLLESDVIETAHEAIEQFPTWLPHVTLGYPDTPALAEYEQVAITFDRLAVWHGESRTEYPLGGHIVPAEEPTLPGGIATPAENKDHESDKAYAGKIIHPENPEFTQEMADAFVAAVDEKEVAPAIPAAEEPQLSPWHGVLAPENLPSGDARQFAVKALTSRDLPLPLKAMFIDDEGHKGSVVVGRIDEIYRDGGMIKATGVWDISEDAEKARGMIERRMWRGVSVDLDAAEGQMVEATEEGGQDAIEFSKGRVCSATLCAIPAFAEAFIRNGTWAEFANEPLPSGAMVEIPDWPGEEATGPGLSLVASGAAAPVSAEYFRNPELAEPTPVTRGKDGHIFGHLGEWGTCHIGFDVCVTPPPSITDYAYFLTGQVFTDVGPVAVGQLTIGGGHAPDGISVRAAIAHYDNVASAVADITVGEDDHGIWFSGRIRPWATEQQIHELFAAGPSGDWREVRSRGVSSLELCAAHAVNVPGFPVPRARFAVKDGRQTSLVAAGALGVDPATEFDDVVSELRAMELEHIDHQFNALKGE